MPAVVDMSSTPHGAMDSTPNDKKRNKLGYHRTSVACGRLDPVALFLEISCSPFSSLPSTQDPLPGRGRRCPRPLRKLHPLAQRVPVLPRRPATPHREEIASQFAPGIRVDHVLVASHPQRPAVASSSKCYCCYCCTTTTTTTPISTTNGCSTTDPDSAPAYIRSVLLIPSHSHDRQPGGAVYAGGWVRRKSHITISRLVSSTQCARRQGTNC